MKNKCQVIIYVGKAKNLRNRVRSYFSSSENTRKTATLVNEIVDFEIIISQSEVEALLLERTLIRHHAPRYNIELRDDKEYPYVRIDIKSPWPVLEKVRRVQEDGALYVGPFANSRLLNYTLKSVFRAFPIVRCSAQEFQRATRPCHYYHMKMCLAPCTLPVDNDEYQDMIQNLIKVLNGEGKLLGAALKKKMLLSSQAENFELAGRYRDQIAVIKKLSGKQVAVIQEILNGDVINFYQNGINCSFSVLVIRNHNLLASENFDLEAPLQTYEEILSGFLLQYYGDRQAPSIVILPNLFSDLEALQKAVAKKESRWIVPRKTYEKDLMKLALKNARHHFESQMTVRQLASAELESLGETLGLAKPIRRIECIDISNTGESQIVASCVCFLDGKKSTKHYRRYQLSQEHQNDFSAIEEVVFRRISRGIEEGNLPDLLMVDGGKGQLSAAEKGLKNFPSLEMPLISLAKARTLKSNLGSLSLHRSPERVFISGKRHSIALQGGSPSYRLLTQLRNEAHRFAISYHRQQRQKKFQESPLEGIKGVGPTLRKRLILHFSTFDILSNASVEEIAAVPGISMKLAQNIFDTVRQ